MVRDNLLGFGFMRLPLVDEEDRTVIDLDRVNRMVDAYIDAGYDYFEQDTIITVEIARRQSGNAL